MLRILGLGLLFLAVAFPAAAEKLAKTKDGPPPPFAVEELQAREAQRQQADFDLWKKHQATQEAAAAETGAAPDPSTRNDGKRRGSRRSGRGAAA